MAEQVDGFIITPVQTKRATIENLKTTQVPFVLLARHFNDLEANYVIPNEVQGGFLATSHLLEMGHTRIAMINAPLYISSAQKRLEGYKKALIQYGMDIDESLITAEALTVEEGYKVAKSILRIKPRPTAVFAYSDFVAFGVMRAIREAGLKIPDDVSVVGFDDIEFSSCLEVPLTTIRSPKEALGIKAIRLLNRILKREKVAGHEEVILDVQLVIRQSTSACVSY